MTQPTFSLRSIFALTTVCAVAFAAIAAARGAAYEVWAGLISAGFAFFVVWLSGFAKVHSPQGDVAAVLGRRLGEVADDAPLALCVELKRAVVVLAEVTPILRAQGAAAAEELGWRVTLHDASGHEALRREAYGRFLVLPGVTTAIAANLFDNAIYDYQDLLALDPAKLAFATGLYGRTGPLLDEARRRLQTAERGDVDPAPFYPVP